MHITRRNGVYYFRKKIPADLVAIYGKREIIYSLRTKDRPMAARLALRAAVQLDDEFSLKRGEPVPPERIAVTPDQTAPLSTQGAAERRAPKSNKVTLACLIPIWRRENNPTDKTADAVARAVSEVGNPHIGTITRATVAAMRDRWLERGNTASTVTKKVGFIRLLLTVGRNRGLIESNPAEGMALPADTRAVELRQPFSTRQVTAILSATAEYRDSPIYSQDEHDAAYGLGQFGAKYWPAARKAMPSGSTLRDWRDKCARDFIASMSADGHGLLPSMLAGFYDEADDRYGLHELTVESRTAIAAGDTVLCIDVEDAEDWLTLGKTYRVNAVEGGALDTERGACVILVITDDSGDTEGWHHASHFIPA